MRRRKKKRCFSLFAPVLPPPISLRKDTENSPSREPCRTTLLKRWPSFFLLRREIDSDGQSERAASEFFFALVSIGRFFSLFAFYLSLFLALGSSRGGARERDGVDGKREKRGRRKKQRGFFLLMLEEQKSKQSPTPLSTSHFSLLCSPPSLFTLSMRLKKRPRLLLCAPRRLAMPLHPAPAPLPPLSTAEEEEEGELRSEEEEDEGLPCADAAAAGLVASASAAKETRPLLLRRRRPLPPLLQPQLPSRCAAAAPPRRSSSTPPPTRTLAPSSTSASSSRGRTGGRAGCPSRRSRGRRTSARAERPSALRSPTPRGRRHPQQQRQHPQREEPRGPLTTTTRRRLPCPSGSTWRRGGARRRGR